MSIDFRLIYADKIDIIYMKRQVSKLQSISKRLFDLSDTDYKNFSASLMPTIDKDRVIGVRVPIVRKFAKEIFGTQAAKEFTKALPHEYFEENNLHAFLIANINDYKECVAELDRFLPYIDNWATCDSLRPVCFSKNKDLLIKDIYRWLSSKDEYAVRFGIEMLMVHYLGDCFKKEYAERVANIKSDKYYINMMIAWYFATGLAKNYNEFLPFIKDNKLSPWVHNKAIQKSTESYRITDEQKAVLRKFKV